MMPARQADLNHSHSDESWQHSAYQVLPYAIVCGVAIFPLSHPIVPWFLSWLMS